MPRDMGEARAREVMDAAMGAVDPGLLGDATADELAELLGMGVAAARARDLRRAGMAAGSAEVTLTFTTHTGKVGSGEEKWACFAPQSDTARILAVAEAGSVTAVLTPAGLPVDPETGELLDG